MDGNPLPEGAPGRMQLTCGWTYADAVQWLALYDNCAWVTDQHTNLTGAAEFVVNAFDVSVADVKGDVRRVLEAMGLPTDDVDGDDGDYLAPGVADYDGDDLAYSPALVDDVGGGP